MRKLKPSLKASSFSKTRDPLFRQGINQQNIRRDRQWWWLLNRSQPKIRVLLLMKKQHKSHNLVTTLKAFNQIK